MRFYRPQHKSHVSTHAFTHYIEPAAIYLRPWWTGTQWRRYVMHVAFADGKA